MASNITRRRISDSQHIMLSTLADGKAHMVSGIDACYAEDDRKQQAKMQKRAMRRLEHWGLVRVFLAPHPEADKNWTEYRDEENEFWLNRGAPHYNGNVSVVVMRDMAINGRIAPSGNRKQPVLWAEITPAGVALLTSSSQPL
jgi:hypothetical protein